MAEGLQAAALFGLLDFEDRMTPGLDKADKNAKGFGASMSGTLKGIGSEMSSLGRDITTFAAPIAGFFGLAIKAWSDYGDQVTQSYAVLESTHGIAGVTQMDLINQAEALSKVTRFAKDTTMSAENMLLTFTNIHKDVFPAATKTVLDMSQALGQDTKSSAIQLGKALNDPIKGVTALQRVGVTFTAAQKEQIKTLVESGHLMEAQKVILSELSTEFGGSAEAAGHTFAGQIDILNHSFNDLLEQIGMSIMPILTELMDQIKPIIASITDWIGNNTDLVGGIGIFAIALATLGPVLMIVGAALGAIGGIVAFILSPIGLLVAAVAALGIAFSTNFLGIRDILTPIIDTIKGVVYTLVNSFQQAVTLLQHGVPLGDVIKAWFAGFGTYISNFVTEHLPGVLIAFNNLVSQIGTWFSTSAWPTIQAGVSAFFTSIGNWIGDPGAGGALNFIKGIGDAVLAIGNWLIHDGLGTLLSGLLSLSGGIRDFFTNKGGADFIQGIGDAIRSGVTWLTGTALPLIGGAFQKIIDYIVGLLKGIGDGIINTVQGAVNRMKNIANGQIPAGNYAANDIFGSLVHNIFSRDSGGPGMAGQPYMIGSGAQPEMFVPKTNGTFIPNADQIGSNVTITLNVTEGNARQAGFNFAGGLGDRLRAKGLTSG